MKTADEILSYQEARLINGKVDEDFGHVDLLEIPIQNAIAAMKQYALECIKADRIQVAENAKIRYEDTEINESGTSSRIRIGVDLFIIDKESILTCPIADLK